MPPLAPALELLGGCLHWRNFATSALESDYLDGDRGPIWVELYEHARGDFLRRIRRHALGAECDMEHVGFWIVTGPNHSFAPLSQCALIGRVLAELYHCRPTMYAAALSTGAWASRSRQDAAASGGSGRWNARESSGTSRTASGLRRAPTRSVR